MCCRCRGCVQDKLHLGHDTGGGGIILAFACTKAWVWCSNLVECGKMSQKLSQVQPFGGMSKDEPKIKATLTPRLHDGMVDVRMHSGELRVPSHQVWLRPGLGGGEIICLLVGWGGFDLLGVGRSDGVGLLIGGDLVCLVWAGLMGLGFFVGGGGGIWWARPPRRTRPGPVGFVFVPNGVVVLCVGGRGGGKGGA